MEEVGTNKDGKVRKNQIQSRRKREGEVRRKCEKNWNRLKEQGRQKRRRRKKKEIKNIGRSVRKKRRKRMKKIRG